MAGTYIENATGAGMAYGMHARVRVVVTDTNTTTCSVTVECWAISDGGYSGFIDGRCSAAASGAYGSYTGHDQDVTSGGSTRLNHATFNVDRGTSDRNIRFYAQIKGTSTDPSNYYYGKNESVSVLALIPAIPYTNPNPPTSCTATRNSDAQATVTWVNGSTSTTKPRSATLVERSINGSSWVQIASVSSSATSYADDGISANCSFKYRVRASNSVGYSAYSESGTIYTTPAAPSEVSVTKTSTTTLSVDATVDAPHATGYDVQRSTDGGATWSEDIATNAALPITDNVAGTVRYRVRSNLSNSLYSAWKQSADITTIVPPLAPTIVERPADPTVKDSRVTISWTPNHPDGTSQSAAQVKVTYPNGSSTTFGVTTATSWTSSALTVNGTYAVQVRTKGLDESYGAWSEVISWGVYSKPIVVIDQPISDGAAVVSLPTNVLWTVTDDTGVASQRLALKDALGREIFKASPAVSARSLELGVSDVTLENGSTYYITLTVGAGSGLSESVTRSFVVDWLTPAPPTIEIDEGDDKSATIVVTYNQGDTATSSVDVMRVAADGSSWTIATSVENGGIISDPLPPLNVPVQYVAVASTTFGSSASATFEHTFDGEDWALNFGESAQHVMTLMYALSNARTLDHGGKFYHFADGGAGGGLPVFYPTTDREQSGTLKFALIYHDDADRLFELSDKNPVGWIRDANGRRWRAKITVRESYIRGPIFRMTADWEAVRWREAW